MAYIIESPNPFEATRIIKNTHEGGITILEWLCLREPGFVDFPVPTFIMVNGQGLMRKEWNVRKIQPDDVINIVTCPGGPFMVIAVLVVAVIALSVAFALTVDAPVTPGELPASDPVFSTRGQQNTIRLGEPIECPYGRNRIYPSLATRPYFQYVDNDQFQYSVFCIGQGHYDITEIKIGDSPIDDFQEVTYEVLPPGGSVDFPSEVYTSIEAGGQELYAPNEEDYVAPGWVGPFAANPPGTLVNELQVDVVFPRGLYLLDDDGGNVDPQSVTVEIEYREIDDAGNPVGAGTWLAFSTPDPYVFTASTTTPQRRTLQKATGGIGFTGARYEVRMRRTDNKNLSHKAGNDAVWESLKGMNFNTYAEPFGDVTLLTVAIRASSNLNERTQIRFNVVATRKLPIYDPGTQTWSAPTTTRSIIWAFVDVFKAQYGARLADNFLDWDALIALDALYTSRTEYFDWIFRDPITVWEAARTIARVGRATPLLVGSLVTLKRDGTAGVPVTIFTPDNIISGSFNWGVRLWEVNEYDSYRIEYTDPSTGYKQEQVLVTLDSTTDNPKDVRIVGIQDRTHAYREGLYMLAAERYLRENITFETGLEGYIPTFGDLVLVVHDIPDWGQYGYVMHAVYTGASNQYDLWLSEPLDWSAPGTKVMSLRGPKGQTLGPYTVTEGADTMKALITIPGSTGDFDFMLGGDSEPMLFVFGVSGVERKLCKIARIQPQGGERIQITCVNYAEEIYDYDAELPDDLPDPPTIPTEPVMEAPANLWLSQIDGTVPIVQSSWSPVQGARRYIVQTSIDGTNWINRGEFSETAALFTAEPGLLDVRVAAITDLGIGPWKAGQITVADLLGLIVLEEWDGLQWAVGWTNIVQAVEWKIQVYDNTGSTPVLKHTSVKSFERRFRYGYYEEAIVDDNVVREHRVEVSPVYHTGIGTTVFHEFSNAIPPAPTGMGREDLGIDSGGDANYRVYWTNPLAGDLIRVKVWLSSVNGFDPAVDTPVVDTTAPNAGHENVIEEAILSIPTTAGAHAVHYWRVGVFDVWGNEISTNISAQQTIPALV